MDEVIKMSDRSSMVWVPRLHTFPAEVTLHLDNEVPNLGATIDVLKTKSVVRSIGLSPHDEGFYKALILLSF